jgi:hypothetical protein
MAIKGNARKTYKTMRGKMVDMDQLEQRNELTPAVGNARVNARGDELGPGGQIIKKREEVVADHYATAGSAAEASGRSAGLVADEPVAEAVEEAVEPVSKTVTRTTKKSATPAEVAAEESALDEEEEWVEDDDGNFVQKGK